IGLLQPKQPALLQVTCALYPKNKTGNCQCVSFLSKYIITTHQDTQPPSCKTQQKSDSTVFIK
ncbi:hypothetical protein, partial [Phascolarctobacterium faecium]|uniref:hypothetical protein n=1 Tax=Phascolarctobacterium faecium TaxID=33025 RepID=UPI00402988AF